MYFLVNNPPPLKKTKNKKNKLEDFKGEWSALVKVTLFLHLRTIFFLTFSVCHVVFHSMVHCCCGGQWRPTEVWQFLQGTSGWKNWQQPSPQVCRQIWGSNAWCHELLWCLLWGKNLFTNKKLQARLIREKITRKILLLYQSVPCCLRSFLFENDIFFLVQGQRNLAPLEWPN